MTIFDKINLILSIFSHELNKVEFYSLLGFQSAKIMIFYPLAFFYESINLEIKERASCQIV